MVLVLTKLYNLLRLTQDVLRYLNIVLLRLTRVLNVWVKYMRYGTQMVRLTLTYLLLI
jgi:hypothetical protein